MYYIHRGTFLYYNSMTVRRGRREIRKIAITHIRMIREMFVWRRTTFLGNLGLGKKCEYRNVANWTADVVNYKNNLSDRYFWRRGSSSKRCCTICFEEKSPKSDHRIFGLAKFWPILFSQNVRKFDLLCKSGFSRYSQYVICGNFLKFPILEVPETC